MTQMTNQALFTIFFTALNLYYFRQACSCRSNKHEAPPSVAELVFIGVPMAMGIVYGMFKFWWWVFS